MKLIKRVHKTPVFSPMKCIDCGKKIEMHTVYYDCEWKKFCKDCGKSYN